jgi:phosphoadenosine phosphosulfate reductase
MLPENFDPIALAREYESKSPQQILKLAFEHFEDLWLSFSGADDIVVLDMAWKINPQVRVFTLDTGRLHAETYRFLEQVRKHYGIKLEVLSPDRAVLDRYVLASR